MKLDARTRKLILPIGILLVLAYLAVPFWAGGGITILVRNDAGESVYHSECEVNFQETYGLPSQSCTSDPNGRCVTSGYASYPDYTELFSVGCSCPSNNVNSHMSVLYYPNKFVSYVMTLPNCQAIYVPTTPTTLPSCVPNGQYASYDRDCCSCQAGCAGSCALITYPEASIKCKSCSATTTFPLPTNTNIPTTTIRETSCSSPYGYNGERTCSGDSLKECQCTSSCRWVTIQTCNVDKCGCESGGTNPTYTLPPTTTVTISTTTTTQADGGGEPVDLNVLLIVGGVVVVVGIVILRGKK